MRLGLRPQLLVMVTVLLGLALVPLFLTATTISRVSLERAEHRAALSLSRSLARSIAAGDARLALADPVAGAMLVHSDGTRSAEGLAVPEAALSVPMAQGVESRAGQRRIVWSWARGNAGMAYVGIGIDTASQQTQSLIGLLAMYMGLLGVGLLLAIHLAITWLIVRPLDALGRAARRVAFGARKLEVPKLPATELVSLGDSLHTMTEKLLSDERELRHHIDEVHLANQRLQQAQERLIRSERLASVGRLAAGLAHEVGNPITAMIGLEELLLDGGLSAEEQRDFLVRIHRETERINRILRDLLDFARPTQQGEPNYAEEPGDVGQSISETLALLQPQKSFKLVTVEAEVHQGLPLVALSRPKLVQVLLNLLLNAADAMTDSQTSKTIRVTATRSAAGVLVVVADNGPGVAATVRDQLFEPFVTTKEVGMGTGLGLAVCRGLVESVGGTIKLDTFAPTGARFVIELPHAYSSDR